MTKEINEDNIRVAAYYIWEQAGRPEGKEKECWIKACEQLFAAGAKSEAKSASKKAAAKTTAKTEEKPAKAACKSSCASKAPKAKTSAK